MTTLQLADVPFDADVANPQGRPLGTREQVAARLGELLPGTTFDDNGRGTFNRGAYQIAFMLYGDPPTSIGVAFNQTEAFTPLARIVEKTGWCLIDPDAKGFVDLAASRSAGRTVLVGEEVPEATAASSAHSPQASAPAPATVAARVREKLPQRTRLLIAALTGLVIASGGLWYANKVTEGRLVAKLPSSILLTQHESPTRLERYEDRIRRRTALTAALAPEFRANAIVQQMLDVKLAARAYWNFVDGKFSSPELMSNQTVWSRYRMPTFLPAGFAQKQRDGYEFEFKGENCEESEPGWPECLSYTYIARPVNGGDTPTPTFAVFSTDDKIRYRMDGRVPTRTDPTVDSRPAVQ